MTSLKLQRDKLKQYQRRIQVILDREHQIAKECLANGQKDKALVALRRRKYQETLLSRTYGQLGNLEELVSLLALYPFDNVFNLFQVSTIEFSLVEQSVLHGLKQGNAVLKEIHKEMNIESVEKLLGETQDAIAYQRVIVMSLAPSHDADKVFYQGNR